MNLVLVKLEEKYKNHLNEMMREWCATEEKIIPYAIRKVNYHEFHNYMNHLEVQDNIDGVVEQRYWIHIE